MGTAGQTCEALKAMRGAELASSVARWTSAAMRTCADRAAETGAKMASKLGRSCRRRQPRGVLPGSLANSFSRPCTPGVGSARGVTASGACQHNTYIKHRATPQVPFLPE